MPLSRHLCLEVEYPQMQPTPRTHIFQYWHSGSSPFFKLFHNRLQPLCSFHPVKNLCDQKQDKRNRQQISDDTDRNRTPHRDIQKCRSCRKQSPTQFQDRTIEMIKRISSFPTFPPRFVTNQLINTSLI